MRPINQQTHDELYRFAQRRLKQGELFILGKVISDKIMLPPAIEENMKLYNLKHRNYIDSVLFYLSDYIYINAEDRSCVYDTVDEFVSWRATVAYRPSSIVFTGEQKTVIDDLCGITRHIDMTKLCSVLDIVLDANRLMSIFSQVCEHLIAEGSQGGADVTQ